MTVTPDALQEEQNRESNLDRGQAISETIHIAGTAFYLILKYCLSYYY
jgi:hypothetical protein